MEPLVYSYIPILLAIICNPFEIHIRAFDPKNNYDELTGNFRHYDADTTSFSTAPPFISGITNLNNDKILIYFVYQQYPFWMTFDFDNGFSSYRLLYKNFF